MIERAEHQCAGEAWQAITYQTITELFINGCSQEPDRPAIFINNGIVVTRSGLLDRCTNFASYLHGRIRPGERVCVMIGNRIELVVALFGIVANRGIFVPIPPNLTDSNVNHIMRDCGPVMAIASTREVDLLKRVRTACQSLENILVLEEPEPDGLSKFVDRPRYNEFPDAACCRDDIVTLNYSSEKSRAKKGRILDHGWWLRALDVDQRLFQRSSQDRQLCCQPLFRLESLLQLLTSLSTRGSLIAMREFSSSQFWDVVRYFDATEVLSDGYIPSLLLKSKPNANERDHRIRIAFHAGVPKKVHRQLVDRFEFNWIDNLFIPECGLVTRIPLHMAREYIGRSSIGVEVPEVEIRIVDDMGNDVADGNVGEALVRGPDLFNGYWGNERDSSTSMRCGWYHTGELIRRDKRGLLDLNRIENPD